MVDEIIEDTTLATADYTGLLNDINVKLDYLINWLDNLNDWLLKQQQAMNLLQGFILFVLLVFTVWFAIKVLRLFI